MFHGIIIYFSAPAHLYQIQPTVATNSKLIISKSSWDVKKLCEWYYSLVAFLYSPMLIRSLILYSHTVISLSSFLLQIFRRWVNIILREAHTNLFLYSSSYIVAEGYPENSTVRTDARDRFARVIRKALQMSMSRHDQVRKLNYKRNEMKWNEMKWNEMKIIDKIR